VKQIPEPTELVYLPRPAWAPAIVAAALALFIVGLFTWWPYAVIGGAVTVVGAWRWLRASIAETARLPRRQRLSTSPLPLTGIASEGRRSRP
jgi:hypothetical protein